MTNVLSINNNRKHMLDLYYNGYGQASFDTEIEPLFFNPTPHDRIQSNKMAIYREDTWDLLGVVSRKYQLVTHKQMINNQRAILERSDLDCSRIEEKITVGGRGAKCFVHHTLPAHSVTTPDGDTAVLTFLGTNSYDGTFSFLLSGGAKQGACMNGQVWTKDAATIYKARHSKSLDINHAARIVGSALEVFCQQNDLWHKMANTECFSFDAKAWFAVVLNLDTNGVHYEMKCRAEDKKLNKDYEYLTQAWNKYSNKLGNNMWALYNTFTDWSTHAPFNRKHADAATLIRKREQSVQKIINLLPLAA